MGPQEKNNFVTPLHMLILFDLDKRSRDLFVVANHLQFNWPIFRKLLPVRPSTQKRTSGDCHTRVL